MKDKKTIEDVLKNEGVFVSTTVGTSMYPMLRNRRDTIIVSPYEGRLKKYDVPLYKRNSDYILHRIVEVRPDSYVICGDNCERKEYDITDEHILGVLTGFYRGSKQINMNGWMYKTYVNVWVFLFPLRKIAKLGRRIAAKVWRKIRKKEKRNV